MDPAEPRRSWADVAFTVVVGAALSLAVVSVLRASRRPRRRASAAADSATPARLWEQQMRRKVEADALPAHEVTELLSLLQRFKLRLYTVPGCPACLLQKLLLANFMPFVENVNCSKQQELCRGANVRGVPAWSFPEGFQVRERVGAMTKKELLYLLRQQRQADFFSAT